MLRAGVIYLAVAIGSIIGLNGCGDRNDGKSLSDSFDPTPSLGVAAQGIHGASQAIGKSVLEELGWDKEKKAGDSQEKVNRAQKHIRTNCKAIRKILNPYQD